MIPVNFTGLPFYPILDEPEDETGEVFCPIIKATYTINGDGSLTLLPFEEQPEVSGPIDYEDDLGKGPRHDDDLVTWKPNVDVLLNAVCYPPADAKVTEQCVAFGVEGHFRKELLVTGPRWWEPTPLGDWEMSEPKPLEPTPLRWEYSFGGISCETNPIGLGYEADLRSDPENPFYSLPRIENPNDRIHDPNDTPLPVNFGPIPEHWSMRDKKLGTRDLRWQVFTAPKPPKDYDPTFMNAAPEDQQVARLRGDEIIFIENCHPAQTFFNIALPNVRPRMFYVLVGDKERTLHELPLNIDTVRVDLEAGQLILLWRSYWEHGYENLDDVLDYIHIVEEKANEKPASAIDYHQPFIEAIPEYEEAIMIANLTAEQVEEAYFPEAVNKIVEEFKKAGMPDAYINRIKQEDNSTNLFRSIQEMIEEKNTEIKQMMDKVKSSYENPGY